MKAPSDHRPRDPSAAPIVFENDRPTWIEALEGRQLLSVSAAIANVRPVIGGLTDSPDPMAVGASLTLVATGAADTDGKVAKVEFYHDTDGNGLFNKTIDVQVGLDGSPKKGWNAIISTAGWKAGKHTFFARSRDNLGEVSKPAVTTCSLTDGKINFLGHYQGSLKFNSGASDSLDIYVTSQTKQAYFAGTFVQGDVTVNFSGTVGRNNTFTMTYSGPVSGSGSGSLDVSTMTLSGSFSTRATDGSVYAGKFSAKKI